MVLIPSRGVLRYVPSEQKVYVEVDQGLSDLARSLVPKHFRVQKPRYPAHITVTRNETVPRWEVIGDGCLVDFVYDPWVHFDDTYFWLRAYSSTLNALREGQGLSFSSQWSRAPDGYESYHITIGNTK